LSFIVDDQDADIFVFTLACRERTACPELSRAGIPAAVSAVFVSDFNIEKYPYIYEYIRKYPKMDMNAVM
jgi:hypothetical protein